MYWKVLIAKSKHALLLSPSHLKLKPIFLLGLTSYINTLCHTIGLNSKCQPSRYVRICKSGLIKKIESGFYWPKEHLGQLIGHKYPIKCYRSYPIADFENYSLHGHIKNGKIRLSQELCVLPIPNIDFLFSAWKCSGEFTQRLL